MSRRVSLGRLLALSSPPASPERIPPEALGPMLRDLGFGCGAAALGLAALVAALAWALL